MINDLVRESAEGFDQRIDAEAGRLEYKREAQHQSTRALARSA